MALGIVGFGHVGIRVKERSRSLAFYACFGFREVAFHEGPRVSILRNEVGLELNLIVNADDVDPHNALMDGARKPAGITHLALRVSSIEESVLEVTRLGIPITEGPVELADGYVAFFVRDPDRNVLELGAEVPR